MNRLEYIEANWDYFTWLDRQIIFLMLAIPYYHRKYHLNLLIKFFLIVSFTGLASQLIFQ